MTRGEWALVGLIALLWWPGLRVLANVWSTVDYASHGYLVPLVSLWAAFSLRPLLAERPAAPLRGSFLWMAGLAGLALLAFGFGHPTLIGLLLVATVSAGVFVLRGAAWLRALAFPLAYLVFLVPLPQAWVQPLIVQLQLMVSVVAVRLLQLGGIAIYREGNVLTLPGDVSLFVAEACSGITSLVTLIALGVFIAYFTETERWRRLALVAAVVPIALAGNLLRVVATVLLAIEVDVEFATTGPLHEWAGVGTYVLGCLGLLAVGELLRRVVPAAPTSGLEPGVS